MGSNDQMRKKLYLMASFENIAGNTFINSYCKFLNEEFTRYPIKNTPTVTMDKTRTVRRGSDVVQVTFNTQELSDSWNKTFQDQATCSCPDGDSGAKCVAQLKEILVKVENIENIPRNTCPGGTSGGNQRLTQHEDGAAYRDLTKSGKKFEVSQNVLYLASKPTLKSLIHTSHFERLIGGSCPSKGANYIACTKYSQAQDVKVCVDLPDYCKNDVDFLGSSAQ